MLWCKARARGTCLFERAHHNVIARVLEALNAPLLADAGCLFGGGTAIAMRYGEFRESVDIDFMVSDLAGYRQLRQLLTGADGMQAIAATGRTLTQAREIKADQYGIRTVLQADDVALKFEIVLEARIAFEPPGASDRICGVSTPTALDIATSKLLANSDRWADDSVFSRDLIDLAMMQPGRKLLLRAIAKAKTAYGDSIQLDLDKAARQLFARPGRLDRCMQVMQINVPPALMRQRIKTVAAA